MKFKTNRIVAFAFLSCLAIAVAPLSLLQPYIRSNAAFPLDFGFLQIALGLTSILILIQLLLIPFEQSHWSEPDFLLLNILVVSLAVHSSCALVQFWKAVTLRIPETYTEQGIYLAAIREGGIASLYSRSNVTVAPFLTTVYPTVYYILTRGLFKIFGESPTVPRALSISAVLVMFLTLIWVLSSNCRRLHVLIAGLLFLSLFPTMCWVGGSIGKSDHVAAAFSLAALSIYVRKGLWSKKYGWIWIAASLGAFAGLTKQTVIFGALAIATHLLLRHQLKQFFIFAVVMLLWPLVSFGLLWNRTDGGIWLMTVTANAARLIPAKILQFGVFGFLFSGFTVMVLAACAYPSKGRETLQSQRNVVRIYFLFALSAFLVAVGRPGASYHYFLESLAAGALVIGFTLEQFGCMESRVAWRSLVILLVTVSVSQLFSQFAITARAAEEKTEQQRVMQNIAKLNTGDGHYILSTPYYVFSVIEAGKKPLVIDSSQFTLMIDNGVVSAEPLLQYLRAGAVPYVILEHTFDRYQTSAYGSRLFPQSVVAYLQTHYSCKTLFHKRVDSRDFVLCAPIQEHGAINPED